MMELLITTRGLVHALYGEAILLQQLGQVQIRRASHVEPDAIGNWQADLSPSEGPVLGPFPYRSTALQAERDWLNQNILFGPSFEHTEMSSPHDTISSIEITPNSRSVPRKNTFQTSAYRADLSE